ncbi:MAG TPA: hypothetical protein VGF45_15615 [Polyangia bacterium]
MNTARTRALALALVAVGPLACATGRAPVGPRPETVVPADPRHGIPPATRESDPETTERRFGFGEARARREEKARAAAQPREKVEVEGVKEPAKTPAKPVESPAKPPTTNTPKPPTTSTAKPEAAAGCPCKAVAGHH